MTAPAPVEPSSAHDLATLRAFAGEVRRMMPGRLAAAVALSLAVSAAEGVSVLMLVQLLSLVGIAVPEATVGRIGTAARAAFDAVGLAPTLTAVLAAYVALVTVQALVQRAQTVVTWQVELRTGLAFRRRLYAAVAGARWLHFTRVRSTDLLQALTSECDRTGYAASYLLSMTVQALVGLVYLAFALRVSAPASGVALACGGALMLALRRQGRRAGKAGEGVTAATGELLAAAGEHLQSMKTVKSYGAEARNAALFTALSEEAAAMHTRAARAYADARVLFAAGSVFLLALVTWVAVEGLGLSGTAAVLLIFLFARLVPRLQTLLQLSQMLRHDLPAYANVRRRIAALEAEREALSDAAGVHALVQGIRFEDVAFAYPAAGRAALSGLDLEIGARRTTALVGPSGSGKTTVADLVMGLVTPDAGRIVVDGRTLEEGWLRGWREGIGYVAQDTVLFHDTVRANLLWASPKASEDEVWEALRAAAADGFVRALPRGLETTLGDRGVRLSGGERQRLALARALLRRPALLILDEATSALDTENERRIRDAIAELHGKTTILLITHRLSSVKGADAIHVLEGGRLVESGDWASLVEKPGGRFRALWASREAEDEGAEAAS
ncbi:MAG TPA: ABC transporter ATP-binding protein [Longimicrobium sp.]|nr:ABC transporter ATP-binding protein [Longimicrobium sp.]